MAKGNKGNTKPKTLFKEDYCEQAENYAYLGVTDAQLGQFFDVTEQTIINWKKAHPKFLLALKKGKDIADAQVAKSLYKRAIGYEYEEEKKEYKEGGKLISVSKTKKFMPPETVACIYWLNNRQPDKWKNRWEPNPDRAITVKIVDDGDNS